MNAKNPTATATATAILTLTFSFLIWGLCLYSCKSEQKLADPIPSNNRRSELMGKLKKLDAKEDLRGKDFIDSFPDAKYQRHSIGFAIGGIVLDEWRIDDEVSLLIFPKPKEYSSPWEDRSTGVQLEIEPQKDLYTEPYLPAQVGSKTDGQGNNPRAVALDPECEYMLFILVKRGSNILDDMENDPLYTSRKLSEE